MKYILIQIFILLSCTVFSQNSWDCSTYPDEGGFQKRVQPMLERIAARDFGQRSLAESKCPDTGLPVKIWAVKGETVISPYTGRAYIQGETGYFGPKKRNENGEIIAFGGDPLKYDLPPATASLLLNKDVERAKAFLSIPGNLRQQYHFACKNWARFYPLLAEEMGDEWKRDFYYRVGKYAESRRPSDGNREWLPLSKAHNLIGEPGELLGGNTKDGGTENHKTMWRTSALLYAQLFPDTAKISGYTTTETEKLVKPMLVDYMKRILQTGNGEYDSQVYYPHSIPGFLNLYDFSPDEETRMLAKFILDYYLLTYGLKVIDGTIAGPQKRGYLANEEPGEMETLLWMYFNNTSRNMNDAAALIHQATTTYLPNQIICDIVNKNLSLPFEGKMSRPFYHMDYAHAFAETFYCSDSYALGNMQMTIVDNPNQQMVWSLVAEGTDGPLCFSGGHPMRASTSGHSPYTQTVQSKGTLALLTAPTKILENADTLVAPNYSKITRPNLWHLPGSEQGKNFEIKNRQKYGRAPLKPLKPLKNNTAKAYESFFEENQGSASSWLYYSKNLHPENVDGKWFFEANNTFVAVIPLGEESFLVHPGKQVVDAMSRKAQRFFSNYSLLVVPGEISGFLLEADEKSGYKNMEDFIQAVQLKTQIDTSKLNQELLLKVQTLQNDKIEMQYIPEGLRCQAKINGKKQNWDKHTKGAVYDTPFVKVKDGKMVVTNGEQGYSVEFEGDSPIWKKLK